MKKNGKRNHRFLFAVICAMLLLTGCSNGEAAENQALFSQIQLFLQEGFRDHQVMNTYTVYFPEPETQTEGSMSLVMQDSNGYLLENLSYSYDAKENWYVFGGSYEPVLIGEPSKVFSSYDALDEEMQDLVSDAIFQTELSINTSLDTGIRFTAPKGPVQYDGSSSIMNSDDGSGTTDYLYLYQDDRLDFTAQIQYPQLIPAGTLEEIAWAKNINQIIRDSFFYGYGSNENESLHPEQEMYGFIQRNYQVTRADEKFLSMRIYEYNTFRAANHPNEWKMGLTIDMETGKKVMLRDVAGNCTPVELLDSKAFHFMENWNDGTEQDSSEINQYQLDLIDTIRNSWLKASMTLDGLDRYFYMTEDVWA